jgi:hypothetical protein
VTGQDEERNSFVRGMTIGAIIGAIVAGSSLWSRRRNRRKSPRLEGKAEPVRELSPPGSTDAVEKR